jgi:hypothetical protein
MKRIRSVLLTLAAGVALLASAVTGLQAQGVTTAAISGRVTDETGQGLSGVQVQVTNGSTGYQTGAITREGGYYTVQGLPVGGPYSIRVSGVGRTEQTRQNFSLSLGQDLRLDFQLALAAVQLSGITVQAESNPVLSSARKGTMTLVSDSALRRLPTLNRNFTDFVNLTPQISKTGPGLSGGGVNNRFNNIQIDGTSENDLFGLGSTGQPGGQANGKSISVEAVKEYQVLLSPFDVRQGNFAGALINAVTKNGTNEFHGSGFVYTRNDKLARDQPYITKYYQTQYGMSLGGPIVKDRVHFFVAPEWQRRSAPASGPYLGQAASAQTPVPASEADINRFSQLLEGYGINPGIASAVNNTNPLTNLFARIDIQLPKWNSRLVLRDNYGRAEDQVFSRSAGTFSYSSNAYNFTSEKNALVGQLFTTLPSGANNELYVGYNPIRDRRASPGISPQISVTVENPNGGNSSLRAGTEQFSQGNELDQDIFELTDNFTFPVGATHSVTIGTHNEFYHLRNLFSESSYGVYTFSDLDAFEAGTPTTYRVSADLGGGIEAKFNGASYGLYVQDQWQPSDRFSLTAGIRADLPRLLDEPAYTPVVDSLFHRNTSDIPSFPVQFSPRVGFNWDVMGDATSQLRGGVGVFVGRPAFVWVGNSFQNSGSGLGILNCSTSSSAPGTAPDFIADAEGQPRVCANGQGLGTGVVGPVDLMAHDLKFPSTFRANLAYDRQLPGGFVGTLEGLYTKGLENFFYTNLNLQGPQGVGPHGRVMYGTISTSGFSNPAVVSSRFSEVIDVTNQSKDYAYNLTAGLQKRFSNSFELRGSYTYSRARDVMSLTSSRAISNWQYGRTLVGNQTDQETGISLFDQPHKVLVSGMFTMPWERYQTDINFIYTGQSGAPFTYVYGGFSGRGDLNADGVTGNDPLYVPTDATDPSEITFEGRSDLTADQQAAAFEEFIEGSPCLSAHRGEILPRNSCRNKWQNFLDVTARQSLPTIRGQSLTLELGIFNFLNLINDNWGQVSTATGNSTAYLLTTVGQTAGTIETSQPIFQYTTNNPEFTSDTLGSNYQIQLSLRYSF